MDKKNSETCRELHRYLKERTQTMGVKRSEDFLNDIEMVLHFIDQGQYAWVLDEVLNERRLAEVDN